MTSRFCSAANSGVDSTICCVYGHAKHGAEFGYRKSSATTPSSGSEPIPVRSSPVGCAKIRQHRPRDQPVPSRTRRTPPPRRLDGCSRVALRFRFRSKTVIEFWEHRRTIRVLDRFHHGGRNCCGEDDRRRACRSQAANTGLVARPEATPIVSDYPKAGVSENVNLVAPRFQR